MKALPQQNLGFDPTGIFFDEVSAAYPSCYQSEIAEDGARLCLRFDQIFSNVGEGAMELRYSIPSGSSPGLTPVAQRLYWSDGPSHVEDRLAGEVEFHGTHGHYHFTGFGLSRLWSFTPDGNKSKQPVRERKLKRTVSTSMIRTGRKVSFCLADTAIDAWARKGDGPRTYNAPDCLFPSYSAEGRDHFVQGITAGWADIYDWYLPGQFIDVAGVADGTYILETIADPDSRLLESDESNNCTSIYIRLTGMATSTPSVAALGPGPACSSLVP